MSKAQGIVAHFDMSNSDIASDVIGAIAFDQLGNTWIGTDNGLCKYNAGVWTTYNTSNSGLPHNIIKSIFIDALQNIWIGTFNGGISKYDGISWMTWDQDNSILGSNHVRSIESDIYNNIWIGTTGGLGKMYNDTIVSFYSSDNSAMYSSNVSSIVAQDNDSTVWFGFVNGGLAKYKNDSFYIDAIWNSDIPDNTIMDMALSSSEYLWLAHPYGGVSITDGSAYQLFNYDNCNIQSMSIRTIALTMSYQCMGTMDSGLLVYNGSNFRVFHTTNSLIASNDIARIRFAPDGTLWVGHISKGIDVIDINELESINEKNNEICPTISMQSNQIMISCEMEIKTVLIYDILGKNICTSNNIYQNNIALHNDPGIALKIVSITLVNDATNSYKLLAR